MEFEKYSNFVYHQLLRRPDLIAQLQQLQLSMPQLLHSLPPELIPHSFAFSRAPRSSATSVSTPVTSPSGAGKASARTPASKSSAATVSSSGSKGKSRDIRSFVRDDVPSVRDQLIRHEQELMHAAARKAAFDAASMHDAEREHNKLLKAAPAENL